ncbi:MAG TPA: Hpt domain-containing protein [Gemmatimonadaceae bacterium]|nr:Hpt domain-containing protein [Gemmatimonadaceae bacterium]
MPQFDDAAIARLRRFGGNALLFEMIDLFLGGATERVALARNGVADGDCERVRAVFHSMKSSTGQLGAVSFSVLCQRAEELAGAGDLAGIGSMLPELDAEFAAMCGWLSTIRAGEG